MTSFFVYSLCLLLRVDIRILYGLLPIVQVSSSIKHVDTTFQKFKSNNLTLNLDGKQVLVAVGDRVMIYDA